MPLVARSIIASIRLCPAKGQFEVDYGQPLMKKTVVTIMLLLLCRPVLADDWGGSDKAVHFTVSLAMTAGVYGGLWAVGEESTVIRASAASLVAFLPGLFKELYDAGQRGNRFSGADMFYNLLGIVSGCAVMLTIDLLTRPRNNETPHQAAKGLIPSGSGARPIGVWRF